MCRIYQHNSTYVESNAERHHDLKAYLMFQRFFRILAQAVTKQYGCLILMTDAIIKLMSVEVAEAGDTTCTVDTSNMARLGGTPERQECRIIDHVRLSATKAFMSHD